MRYRPLNPPRALSAGMIALCWLFCAVKAGEKGEESLVSRWKYAHSSLAGVSALRDETAQYAVRIGWFGRGSMTTSLRQTTFEGRPVWHARRYFRLGKRMQDERAWLTCGGLLPLRYSRRIALPDGRQRVDELFWDHLAGELSLDERIEDDGKIVQVKSREVWRLGEDIPMSAADPVCLWWRSRAALLNDFHSPFATNGVAVISVDDVFDWRLTAGRGENGAVEVEEQLEPHRSNQASQCRKLTLDPARRWLPQSGRARLWGREVEIELQSARGDGESR